MELKAVVGLRPSFSSHVRWCERGVPLRSCEVRSRLEGEAFRIPHLAKNERDMGHPAIGVGMEPQKRVHSTLSLIPENRLRGMAR